MAGDDTTLSKRVAIAIEQSGMTRAAASKAAGLSPTYVRDLIEARTTNPKIENLRGLANVLKVSFEWLAFGKAESDAIPTDHKVPDRSDMPRDLPVLGTAAGARSETDGAAQLTGGVVEYLRRPPALQGVADAYVVYVVNDSMEPALPHGEVVCVNPNRPARPGDNVVIQIRGDDGETYAYVKTLVRMTSKEIICSQLNPPKELHFDRSNVIAIHRVLTVSDIIAY